VVGQAVRYQREDDQPMLADPSGRQLLAKLLPEMQSICAAFEALAAALSG
jgi:hypothetical protein